MAEAILNKMGESRFLAFSAGSRPIGKIHPLTIEFLQSLHYETSSLRSKSWLDFSYTSSPEFDMVIMVCPEVAAEVCPVWPGDPVTVHWKVPNPILSSGNPVVDQLRAFGETYQELEWRIQQLVKLPTKPFTRERVLNQLKEIEKGPATEGIIDMRHP